MAKTSMLREERTEAVVLAAIVFLVLFCNSLFPPILPSLANEFAVSPLQLKWLVPGFSLTYGAATLVYGISSDRVGRPLILKCLLLSAAVVVTGLSIVSTAHQLIVLRCVSGLGIGGIVTVALSSVGDRYPYRLQGRPMGVMFGVITAGMGLGASVGPMMSETIGWRWTLRIIAAGFLIGALWAHGHYAGQARERPPKANRYSIIEEYSCVLNAPRGLRPLIFIIANGAFHGGIFAWLGLLIVERYRCGEFGVGAVMIGYGLPDLLLGGVIGGLADRFGRRYTVPTGFIWAAICAIFLAASRSWWMATLAITGLSMGYVATHPSMSSMTTSIDPKHRGQLTGMTTFGNYFGMAIGALIFCELLRFGFTTALVAFGTVQGIIGMIAAYCMRAETLGTHIVEVCNPNEMASRFPASPGSRPDSTR